MATLQLNAFSRFKVSENEERIGNILSQENLYVIANLIADAAEHKIALAFDPASPNTFLQNEAFLRGKLEILQYLQAAHEAALKEIRNLTHPTHNDEG